jgi:hypothetical protein
VEVDGAVVEVDVDGAVGRLLVDYAVDDAHLAHLDVPVVGTGGGVAWPPGAVRVVVAPDVCQGRWPARATDVIREIAAIGGHF